MALPIAGLASPWIEVGEKRLRNHLQLLSDSGLISPHLSSWPIMWADVKSELEQLDQRGLTPAQKIAINELGFEQRYQTRQGLKRSVLLSASNSRTLLKGFSSESIEKGLLSKEFDWDGESWSIQVQTNLTTDPGEDDTDFHLDQSYVAGVLGEWVVGAGAIDRWWGPGRYSSLILSNNARPVPAVFFKTKSMQSFESPWLSWIGSWHFETFIGQMESDRAIPETKLTGMRLSLKPTSNLEIGLSRLMQWGGEGRDEDLQAFFNSVTSRGENTDQASGNQQAGMDIRYSLASFGFPAALYMQTIGEDEAGYLPARKTFLFGGESTYSLSSASYFSLFLEYTNTTADPFSDEFFNMTYEHNIYQSGLRFEGRVLGASFDNDAEVVTLGADYVISNGHHLSIALNSADLNRDGVESGNTVSSDAKKVYFGQLDFQTIVFDGQLNLGVSHYSEQIKSRQKDVDETSISVSWKYRF